MNYKITSLTATQKDGTVSVSGTAEDGALAVAISVYDSAGEELISLETTSVSDDGTFSRDLKLPNDDYMVKVADYEGGEYRVFMVSAEEEAVPEEETAEEEESTASAADTGRLTVEDTTSSTENYLAPVLAGSAIVLAAIVAFVLIKRRNQSA